MSVKITVDKTGWDKLKKNLLQSNRESLKLGFFEDSRYGPENDNLNVAQVAQFMEEGDPVKYPPRPFIRIGFLPRLKTPEYIPIFQQAIKSVLDGQSSFRQAYTRLGPVLVKGLQNEIIGWDTPPNSPQTIEAKGFNHPLINTGKMLESVDFKVERGD
jgi:hypothetical protein